MNYRAGYLIAEVTDQTWGNYQGFGGMLPWPLDCRKDQLSVSLAEEGFMRWMEQPIGSLALSGDVQYVTRYCRRCISLSIAIRVFWIECGNEPHRGAPQDRCSDSFEFLGWDYLASADASYLFDDGDALLGELYKAGGRLNEHDLFPTLKDAKQYASLRKRALERGMRIEQTGDEYFVRVFRVIKIGELTL